MQRRIIYSAITLAVILADAGPSIAAGAMAVGLPSDVVKQGVSMGFEVNIDTTDNAKSKAIERCQKNGSVLSKSLCNAVATFSNRCVAIAIDPKVGTPGFGWAIADTYEAAKDDAISNCRKTAGPGRTDFCLIANSACDGSAK